MQESAGTLLYRRCGETIEVLLVHPSGAYNRKAPWSIPKGLPDAGEDLEAAARRETKEETGVDVGALTPLAPVVYRTRRKRIHCFAGEVLPATQPSCASWEIDQAEFLSLDEARRVIHPDQRPLLDELERLLAAE